MRPIRPIALLLATLVSFSAAAAQQPTVSFPQALEAKGTGIKIFSLYDENSPSLRELATGEIVIAKAGKPGWYEIEVPAGYACWVYSRFLDETGVLGMGIVTDDRVNARAVPSSEKNYPIGKLSKGDQVRVLDHKGEWTQIQAPASLHLWVRQDAVTPIGTPESVSGRIETFRTQAESEWKTRLTVLEQQREEEKKRAMAREAFMKAEDAFTKERAKAQDADFAAIRAMYKEASANADQALQEQIKARLASLDALETVIQEKASAQDLEQRAKAMDEKVKTARDKAMAEAEGRISFASSDKLFGRYQGAGWLRRSLSVTKGYVYTLEKGGIVVCEIADPKGRYDLADYVGHEIGIKGRQTSATGETKRFEIAKIEVLAAP